LGAKERGPRVVEGEDEEMKVISPIPREACASGTLWIDANVRVRGFVRTAMLVGSTWYIHPVMTLVILRGKISRGSLTRRARNVEKQIVPAMV
jgi:hypothetical protein